MILHVCPSLSMSNSLSLALLLSLYDSHTHLHNSPSHLSLPSPLPILPSSSSSSSSSPISLCFRARASPRRGLRNVPSRPRKETHVREHHRAVRGEVAGPTRRMRALRFTPGYLSFPASAVGMDSHGYSAIFFLSGVGGFNVGCVCELFILRIVCFCLCARLGFAAPVSFFVWDF